jgi:NAD(P)H dehydrogenase (quinone)
MTKYVINGASALVGLRTADNLLETVAAEDITLVSRNTSVLQKYADKGVRVIAGSYNDESVLHEAYKGADRLFMISGLNVGQRVPEHRLAIDVAKKSGIEHITYTSVAAVHPSNPTPSAGEHLTTEEMLQESGLSFTAMRNQYYSDLVHQTVVDNVLAKNRWVQNNEFGHIVPVSRNDIADCASAIMLEPQKHHRVIYEITGPERLTFPQIAEISASVWGVPIQYMPVTDATMLEIFEKIGVTRNGDPTNPSIAHKFGWEELIPQCQAYESGLYDTLSGHVKYITGKEPETLEATLKRLIAENS